MQLLFGITGYFQVEAGIIDQNQDIGTISCQIVLAQSYIFQDLPKVQCHLHKTHIGHFAIMAHKRPADLLHGISPPKAEFGLRVALANGTHKIGCMQVARCFTGNQIIFHIGKYLTQK